jgi:chemotaxis protein CheZ
MNTAINTVECHERLGGIVRQLHEALSALGHDHVIRQIAHELPDARDRLAYVGGMTEAAANKVLNLVDVATPACRDMAERASQLHSALMSDAPDPAAPLLAQCADLTQAVAAFSDQQRSVLTDIMMAQDFQDLSGQVIGKVIQIINRTENQLVELLLQTAPPTPAAPSAELTGPQVPEKAFQQDDVDDLLSSLGF